MMAGITAMGGLTGLKKLSDELKEEDEMMPVLFVGHGSPMNAIEDNEFSQRWAAYGKSIPQPKAVICVSAHWLTKGTKLTAMTNPPTIHDFGGFPDALHQTEYPAPGSPFLAKETRELIKSVNVDLDHEWGLDHGTWSILNQMYPKANIPVIQLSIDYYKSPQFHYELAKELTSLRKKGVLIIGSGNMVHNLGMISIPKSKDATFNSTHGYDWAIEINEQLKKAILDGNHPSMIDYEKFHKHIKLAVPSPDHYYPLLYVLGLQHKKDTIELFNDKVVAGSLTMTSVKFG